MFTQERGEVVSYGGIFGEQFGKILPGAESVSVLAEIFVGMGELALDAIGMPCPSSL